MGELRKDYILERYVIIATERGKRPDQFKQEKELVKEGLDYFAPGNEKETPPEICRYPEKGKKWQIRVFPNKFPAVKAEGKSQIETHNGFFTFADAYGNHEVIVETPDIKKSLADLSKVRIKNVLKVFQKRILANLEDPNIKYVSVFKNHGDDAGTSIQHTHCQLIAYNIIPELIRKKEDAVSRYGYDPYDAIINAEKDSLRRCYENDTIIAFCPYASRFPFEVMILPKRHVLNITEFNENELKDLAEILKKVLLKLKKLNADYNFYLQYGIEKMRFHIEVTPRLSKWAGFEHSTGTIINTMTPENAAEFYRKTN